jgi:surface polysaccharide O-acyltransferase-like enzyme
MARKTCLVLIVVGLALTAVGTYALAATQGGQGMYFFQQYFSPTVILASVMVFLLLLTVKPVTANQDAKPAFSNKIVHLISQNTLGIFFIHVMIIESIEAGYFGFTINRYILDPILEVPLLTAIVLFASLGIILLLRRVPYLNRLIGTADR